MEDTVKINTEFRELYNSCYRDFKNFDKEQLMKTFDTIPYLGRWSLFLELAEEVVNRETMKTHDPQDVVESINIRDIWLSWKSSRESIPAPGSVVIVFETKRVDSQCDSQSILVEI